MIRRFLPDNTYEDWKAHAVAACCYGLADGNLGEVEYLRSRLAALRGELELPRRQVSELLDLE